MSTSPSSVMTEEARRAHAGRALEEFKRLISVVYAPLLRAVTGKKSLKVEPAGKISATDGKTVWLMVPWVLGETREHDRSYCGKRDAYSKEMLCPACAVRDEIDSTVFHESAHLTEASFEEVEPERIREFVKKHCPFVDADALDLPSWYKGRRVFVQVLAHFIEPVYLPTIQNVVEDIYVNRRLFKVRPGTEPSLQAHMVKVFEKGFHQADGTQVSWSDQPLDAQAVMGVYNLGMRLPHLNQNLDPIVDKMITSDEVLVDLMEAIPAKGDAYTRAEIGLQVLARLRELGFCIPPSQQEQPPEPQGEDDGSEESEQDGEDESSEPSPSGGQGGTGSTKGEEASDEDEDSETEGKDGEPSDDASDEESDEGEPSGPGTETSGDDGESEDDDQSKDDAEGSGSGDESDEESDEKPEGSGSGDDDDAEDDADEDGEDTGSGQGDDEAEGYESDDGEAAEEPQPTPEELDKQAAEEIAKMAKQMFGHEDQEQEDGNYTEPEDGLRPMGESQDDDVASELDQAIKWQKFDAPPRGINDFKEIESKVDPDLAYSGSSGFPPIVFDPGLVSGETARLRGVFAANRKRRISGSLKSGPKLDVPNLHRIGQDDFRIFGRQDRPDRRDWFVLIGLDDSGSTLTNGAAKVIREMGLGIGEMLNGVGVKFAMYAHSGRFVPKGTGICVTHKVLKGPDEPWTSETKERLQFICREDTGNLDGHTLEQYRKVIEARRETDKMILYVTDGAMPMANYNEELEVLQRELEILRRQRVNLFGVGYRTDSPKQHGMDTVVVEDGQDLPGLISGLRSRLEV